METENEMEESTNSVGTTELAEQAAIDTTGVTLAICVALVAAGLLIWHIQQAKKRPATTYDKAVGGLWAAVVVLAVWRTISLLV